MFKIEGKHLNKFNNLARDEYTRKVKIIIIIFPQSMLYKGELSTHVFTCKIPCYCASSRKMEFKTDK